METILNIIFDSLFIVYLIYLIFAPTIILVVWFQSQLMKREAELLELNKPDRTPKWQAKESDSKRS